MSRWRAAPELAAGLRLLESGATRAAHEAWESAWRAHAGTPLGEVARALSQWAAACVHLENGREPGFRSLAAKSAARLALPGVVAQFDTGALSVRFARAAAADPAPDPAGLRTLGG